MIANKCENKKNTVTKLHSIHSEFILKYITLTDYYIVMDALKG